MRAIHRPLALAVLGLFAAIDAAADLSSVPGGRYELDPAHGYVLFSYSHLGFSNPSVGFNRFETVLDLDADNAAASKLDVEIDAASIDSRVDEFNEHLNSSDLFDTGTHPTITFGSTTVEPLGDDRFKVTGELTIKGITKPVVLDATINKAGRHPLKGIPAIGVTATGKLSRSEWGLDNYVPAVSDEVTLRIEVELLKAND